MRIYLSKFCLFFYYVCLILIIGFGLFVRLRIYLSGHPIWLDEIYLHLNVMQSFSHLFKPLDDIQIAPPLYLCAIKLLTELFGHSVYVVRFISILSGCFSLILFLPLMNKIFKNKIAILSGLFLFSINAPLVYYSNEFKPYETDVLTTVILLLFYDKLNFNSNKNIILWAFVFLILPFWSLSSFAILSAMLILKTIEMLFSKEKDVKQKLLFILKKTGIFYIILIVALLTFWQMVGINSKTQINCYAYDVHFAGNIFSLIKMFFTYMKYDNPLTLIFVYIGIITALFNKNRIQKIGIITICLLLFANYIKIYPFFERLILFMIPIFILFISGTMEINIKNNKYISSFIAIILCIVFFSTINIDKNFKFILSDDISTIQFGTYIERRNIKDEITTFFKMHKKGEKYIYINERFFYFNIKYYNELYGYHYKLDDVIFNAREQTNYTLDEVEEIIKKEINEHPKTNYWVSAGDMNRSLGQEHFIQDVLDRMKLKYKTYKTLNGDLCYLER